MVHGWSGPGRVAALPGLFTYRGREACLLLCVQERYWTWSPPRAWLQNLPRGDFAGRAASTTDCEDMTSRRHDAPPWRKQEANGPRFPSPVSHSRWRTHAPRLSVASKSFTSRLSRRRGGGPSIVRWDGTWYCGIGGGIEPHDVRAKECPSSRSTARVPCASAGTA